jgi:hypothetical protein
MNEPTYDPSYYEDPKTPTELTKFVAIFVLLLEMGAATTFTISFDGLQECCDGTLLPGTTKNEEIWDKVFFWLAVAYLGLVVIEILLVVMECPAAAFNPLIGILLTVVSLYNTKKTELLIMYGLVTAASIGENYALWQD